MSKYADSFAELPDISLQFLKQLRVYQVLKQCDWNRCHAAKILNTHNRYIYRQVASMKEAGFIIPDNPVVNFK